ncbi:MAG: FAD-dependent tricarballylate dehydrogenase TcuA [Dehalococcoidia bacterium]
MAGPYDVVVVGAGNAALCAALAARERGARVAVLEKSGIDERGGNTYYTTGAFRFPYAGLDEIRPLIPDLGESELAGMDAGSYEASAMRADLVGASEHRVDADLMERLITDAYPTVRWLTERVGVRWSLMYGRGARKVDGKFRFSGGLIVEAVGGGAGLSDLQFAACERAGIEVRYDTKALALLTHPRSGAVTGVRVRDPGGLGEIEAKAVVLAAGGFEANSEMRTRYLGAGWESARVTGTRHNTGDAIGMALALGAQSYGQWSGAHAIPWDYGAPPTGNRRIGDLYRKLSYPLGLLVNVRGRRFVDEGADLRERTFAEYSRRILEQPMGIAFQIFDQQTAPLLRDEYRIREITKAEGDTIPALAADLGIDAEALVATVAAYNATCRPGAFDPTRLDGVRTEGLALPKSNWALPLDRPPYLGVAVTCGVTFTFGGLRVQPRSAQVLDTEGGPIPGLYAAGELIGGLFWHHYLGGTAPMAGSVFGRAAGEAAAAAALGA